MKIFKKKRIEKDDKVTEKQKVDFAEKLKAGKEELIKNALNTSKNHKKWNG